MDDKLPKIGESVRITKIVKGVYVVWEGCASPGGGLHWTEFSAIRSGSGSEGPHSTVNDQTAEARVSLFLSPPELGPYDGMTTNERLFAAGLLSKFDKAVGHGDRPELLRLLGLVDLGSQAEDIVTLILGHPIG